MVPYILPTWTPEKFKVVEHICAQGNQPCPPYEELQKIHHDKAKLDIHMQLLLVMPVAG